MSEPHAPSPSQPSEAEPDSVPPPQPNAPSTDPSPSLWAWWALGALLLAAAAWLIYVGITAPRTGPHRLSAARGAGAAAGTCLLALTGLLAWARLRDAALAAWVAADAAGLLALLLGAQEARVHLNLLLPGSLFMAALVWTAWAAAARPGPLRGPRWACLAQGAYFVGLVAVALAAGRPLPGRLWLGLLWAAAAGVLAARLHAGAAPRPWPRLADLSLRGRALLVGLAGLSAYATAAGPRLARPSANNHFVYLAECYLSGRLSLSPAQVRRKTRLRQFDDWARVDRVRLRRAVRRAAGSPLQAGSVLRGTWLVRDGRRTDQFRTTGGAVVRLPPGTWQPLGADWYVSFPPGPAVLMLPGVAIWGYRFNDVWFTVGLAALGPVLLLLLLARLRRAGLSERSEADDLWLTLLFGLGTVVYFVSVRGEVWFTAHVVGILLLLLYLHASLGARFPVLAGLALGFATASRVPLLLAAPLFLWELWRTRPRRDVEPTPSGDSASRAGTTGATDWRRLAGKALRFGLPLALVGAALALHNWARFDSPLEFGHRYLDVIWRERMQRYGLFDVHYLSRNLAAAFALLPHLQPEPPYLLVSRHGLSLLLVSPALLLVLWPRRRSPWHRPLWLSVGAMFGLVLLYQNTGFVQFSYRFSADFTALLVLLLALGGRPLSTYVKVLILWGVLWNLLGAVTFGLAPELYGRTNWIWTPLDPSCRC